MTVGPVSYRPTDVSVLRTSYLVRKQANLNFPPLPDSVSIRTLTGQWEPTNLVSRPYSASITQLKLGVMLRPEKTELPRRVAPCHLPEKEGARDAEWQATISLARSSLVGTQQAPVEVGIGKEHVVEPRM